MHAIVLHNHFNNSALISITQLANEGDRGDPSGTSSLSGNQAQNFWEIYNEMWAIG